MLFFISFNSFTQDLVILKNGDEIESKILEITPELVKYKKWGNMEGPIYSMNKSEVFMIKYANGTKDVFNTSSTTDLSPNQSRIFSGKFDGIWYPKGYNGNSNKTRLTISRVGEDFLVNYQVYEKEESGFFYVTDGSFKEVGRLEGNSIVINSSTKLSLINDNTLLMRSKEFQKPAQSKTQTPTSRQPQKQNTNSNTKTKNETSYFGLKNSRTPLLKLENDNKISEPQDDIAKENTSVKLIINPIQNDGDGFGQITFSQNDNLLIYFTQKKQNGRIIINGDSYSLTSCSNNNSSYKLLGPDISIVAKDLIDESSGDCFHFVCPKLDITLKGVKTIIENVVVKDCLSFSWE